MEWPLIPVLLCCCNSIFNTLQQRNPRILHHQWLHAADLQKEMFTNPHFKCTPIYLSQITIACHQKTNVLAQLHMMKRVWQLMPVCFWQAPCEPVKQLPSLKPWGISQMCCTEQKNCLILGLTVVNPSATLNMTFCDLVYIWCLCDKEL